MNYKAYDTEDFLQDLSFRQFCNGTNQESVYFWEEWLKNNPDHVQKINEARRMYFLLSNGASAEVFSEHRNRMIRKLEENGIVIGNEKTLLSGERSNRISWYWAAAASIVGIILITFGLNRNQSQVFSEMETGITYRSELGEKKSFQLSDGSRIILNGGSILRLGKDFNNSSRELFLEGEAYFDVAHNAALPFIVHNKRFDVKVLGTEFNVRSYANDDKSVAALVRGKIELSIRRGGRDEKIIMKPNQQVVVKDKSNIDYNKDIATSKNKPQPSPIEITPLRLMPYDSTVIETSWTENRLVFADESLEEVAKRLERWFGVSIVFRNDSIRQFRYSGTFDKENLTGIIEALQLSKPFHYEIRQDQGMLVLDK